MVDVEKNSRHPDSGSVMPPWSKDSAEDRFLSGRANVARRDGAARRRGGSEECGWWVGRRHSQRAGRGGRPGFPRVQLHTGSVTVTGDCDGDGGDADVDGGPGAADGAADGGADGGCVSTAAAEVPSPKPRALPMRPLHAHTDLLRWHR